MQLEESIITDFPFHRQQTCWTCGPAAMRMALEKSGIKKSEKQLVRILKTNKIRGTWPRDFPRVAEKYKLDYVVERNAEIQDLEYFQKQNYTLIVCYYFPKEKVDHYSVFKEMDSEKIYFYDPLLGNGHRYSLRYFNKIWRLDPKYDNEKHWLFGVKNKELK